MCRRGFPAIQATTEIRQFVIVVALAAPHETEWRFAVPARARATAFPAIQLTVTHRQQRGGRKCRCRHNPVGRNPDGLQWGFHDRRNHEPAAEDERRQGDGAPDDPIPVHSNTISFE